MSEELKIGKMKFPLDRMYSREHIWAKKRGNKVRLGLDSFLIENAGFLNYISIDKKEVKKGDNIGNFESAKFVSNIVSPISGEIVKINEKVITNPSEVNKKPYQSWIVEVEVSDKEDFGELISDENMLKKFIKEEIKKMEA